MIILYYQYIDSKVELGSAETPVGTFGSNKTKTRNTLNTNLIVLRECILRQDFQDNLRPNASGRYPQSPFFEEDHRKVKQNLRRNSLLNHFILYEPGGESPAICMHLKIPPYFWIPVPSYLCLPERYLSEPVSVMTDLTASIAGIVLNGTVIPGALLSALESHEQILLRRNADSLTAFYHSLYKEFLGRMPENRKQLLVTLLTQTSGAAKFKVEIDRRIKEYFFQPKEKKTANDIQGSDSGEMNSEERVLRLYFCWLYTQFHRFLRFDNSPREINSHIGSILTQELHVHERERILRIETRLHSPARQVVQVNLGENPSITMSRVLLILLIPVIWFSAAIIHNQTYFIQPDVIREEAKSLKAETTYREKAGTYVPPPGYIRLGPSESLKYYQMALEKIGNSIRKNGFGFFAIENRASFVEGKKILEMITRQSEDMKVKEKASDLLRVLNEKGE